MLFRAFWIGNAMAFVRLPYSPVNLTQAVILDHGIGEDVPSFPGITRRWRD